MIWFTSDEHYYHSNIISHRFNERSRRPFTTVSEMNSTIIKHHNEVVKEEDITYHLGDFAFVKGWRDMRHIIPQLKGRHILILGNHDFISPFEFVEAGFESVHTSLELVAPFGASSTPILIHDPAVAGVLKDSYFIHGHTHGLGKQLAPNTYCVSVELTDYYPVPITDIKFNV